MTTPAALPTSTAPFVAEPTADPSMGGPTVDPTSAGPTSADPRPATGFVARTSLLAEGGDLLDHLGPDGFAWLTSASSFVTAGAAVRIPVGPGPDRFAEASAAVSRLLAGIDHTSPDDVPGPGPIAVGALPFDEATPGQLIVPARLIRGDSAGRLWLTEIARLGGSGDDGPAEAAKPEAVAARPSICYSVKEETARAEWTAAVRSVLDGIAAGDVRKVVLARELVLESPVLIDRRAVLDRLRAEYPACFVYANNGFVGASPELLVRRSGDEVRSCPMAGTVRRSPDAAEDDELVAGLRCSAKETEEHALLVDAVIEALAPVCAGPPVAAPAAVVRLATVSHLATKVTGHLTEPGPSALALAGLLHPTPAVGGLPRAAALAAIADLEAFDRGLYAGPVGWVDAAGDGEWAVALRGAELDGARARLIAGAGIVAGSDPEAEWAETEAKLSAMRRAISG